MNNSVTGTEDLGVNSVFYCAMGLWVTHTKAVQKAGRPQQRLGRKTEISDVSSALLEEEEKQRGKRWKKWGGRGRTWTWYGQS